MPQLKRPRSLYGPPALPIDPADYETIAVERYSIGLVDGDVLSFDKAGFGSDTFEERDDRFEFIISGVMTTVYKPVRWLSWSLAQVRRPIKITP